MKMLRVVKVENLSLLSTSLKREVGLTIYQPANFIPTASSHILLVNDGQDLVSMSFENILDRFIQDTASVNLLVVGIKASDNRVMEYGMENTLDYMGRGANAKGYASFIVSELIPYLRRKLTLYATAPIGFAGFSLGGLSALDIVWNHAEQFSVAGIFSGALWWRSIDQTSPLYNDNKHRLMQQQILNSNYQKGLRFFFQCGGQDETNDRNKNGIIDSIDDTRDIITALESKGYTIGKEIKYLEMPNGKHNIASWAVAFPSFLEWAYTK
jgi:enterochelin esterase-like enzyme